MLVRLNVVVFAVIFACFASSSRGDVTVRVEVRARRWKLAGRYGRGNISIESKIPLFIEVLSGRGYDDRNWWVVHRGPRQYLSPWVFSGQSPAKSRASISLSSLP